jgi:beta-lactam-binding protein with PASTA domain
MPNVVGTDLPNARALLQQLGFVVNVIDEEVTDMLAGIVIAQNPAEGIPLEVGEPVDLTVSRVRPHPFPDSTPPPPPTEPIPS